MQVFPDREFIVGYFDRYGRDGFDAQIEQVGARPLPLDCAYYGVAYETILASEDFDSAIVFAPYTAPREWLVGSVNAWLKHYALVGKFRPPRILEAERLMLPLIASVIVELGRLNFDFILLRGDVKWSLDPKYYAWQFGSVLVRSRPGAFIFFKVAAAGYPILTLPHTVKPVKCLVKKQELREADK